VRHIEGLEITNLPNTLVNDTISSLVFFGRGIVAPFYCSVRTAWNSRRSLRARHLTNNPLSGYLPGAEDQIMIENALSGIYRITDKYLHNAQHRPIDFVLRNYSARS
jgi:hypothetical protein